MSNIQTHETNINIIARRTGKDVNSHTVLDGIITTTMATIQRINIIGSREGSRNRRRLKANQTGKKFRVGIKSNIQMLRDFIGIRVNRAKKSGMVNITSSVNSRERSGINTILHELNPLFTINVTMRDIKSKNVYSRVNSKATTQWRKTESA